MEHPKPLTVGSRVAIVSPAGPVTPELLQEGETLLRDWGLEVELHDDVYETHDEHGYLAGTDHLRAQAVQEVMDDPEIGAIIFSRGGYGTMRILPRLDYSRFVSRPKILAGFSDLTALHLYIAGVLDVATLHAPVIKSVGLHQPGGSTLASLREALFGERVAPFDVDGLTSVQPGRASGRVLGGNLTILTHLLDSHFCPDLNGTLLLIEEVGEEDYRLDRMMTALRLSAKAGAPAGILLGDFTDCGGAYLEDDEIDEFVQTLASEFDCPIVADFPSGHGSRNVAVPMGVRATLDATEGRLTFNEDVCSI